MKKADLTVPWYQSVSFLQATINWDQRLENQTRMHQGSHQYTTIGHHHLLDNLSNDWWRPTRGMCPKFDNNHRHREKYPFGSRAMISPGKNWWTSLFLRFYLNSWSQYNVATNSAGEKLRRSTHVARILNGTRVYSIWYQKYAQRYLARFHL